MLKFVLKVFLLTLATLDLPWRGHGQGVQGQLVASTTKFQRFVSLDLAAGLSNYIQHETERMEIIKTVKGYEAEVPLLKIRLQKLQSLSKQIAARKAEYDSLCQKLNDYHPTSALRLISDFLDTWQSKLKNDTLYGFRFAEFLSNKDDSRLPTQKDLEYAAHALAEIQFIYNLSTPDLYAGKVMGHRGAALRPQDAYEVAEASRKMLHLRQAATWYEIALNNTPKEEKVENGSYPVPEAMATLGVLRYGMDERQKGLELLEEATNLDPENAEILRQYLTHRYGRDVQPLVHSDLGEFRMKWFRLCANSSSFALAPVKWYHVCRYRRSTRIPYKVYKEEILSRAPFLSVIYDFIKADEAHKLTNVSADKLTDRAVEGAESDQVLVQGSVLNKTVRMARVVSDRITDLTGLDTEERSLHSSGEPMHVLNYGVSGSFMPHYDIYRKYNIRHIMRRSGYRMASMLIYLSNVKAGGATAFPSLNITVTPRLGNALLWYNTSPHGEVERDIIHAGCTVAVGAKWVASKGIWSWGNELRRPCGRKLKYSHLTVDKIAARFRRHPPRDKS